MSDVFGSTKGFCRFPVSRHFKAPLSVFKRFCCFSCLQTHSKVCRSPASVSDVFGPTKGFCRFPVSRHFPYSVTLIWAPCEWHFWIIRVLLFQDTFEYGKCLETGPMTKSLEKSLSQGICRKVSRNRRNNEIPCYL